ncbi:MAG: N-acetyltransferase [Lachnospiraceae bacterium]|nr:N-acetyltransferase [Lachnospiraceae bacterium]
MICTVKQINILDMLDMYGEDSCKEILSTFICPLNIDVADFIHNKAIEFAKQRIAITFLVFRETEKGNVLTGYYTLANKFVAVSADMLSKTLKKRITKFSQYDAVLDRYLISMPLIAQLGKNYSNTAKEYPISGSDLLDLACQNIKKVQHIIGGKTTYIECASNLKLCEFYSTHDFVPFGKRERENNELADNPVLVQMLRYFKS